MSTSKTTRTRTSRSAIYRMFQEKISIIWKRIISVIVIKNKSLYKWLPR